MELHEFMAGPIAWSQSDRAQFLFFGRPYNREYFLATEVDLYGN